MEEGLSLKQSASRDFMRECLLLEEGVRVRGLECLQGLQGGVPSPGWAGGTFSCLLHNLLILVYLYYSCVSCEFCFLCKNLFKSTSNLILAIQKKIF